MIELAALDHALGLFKTLIDLRNSRRDDRRTVFEKTIQPLFESLTPIVSEYHSAMVEARDGLRFSSTLNQVLAGFRGRRDKIVMARGTIIGLLNGLVRRKRSEQINDEYYDLLDTFIRSVVSLFWASDYEEFFNYSEYFSPLPDEDEYYGESGASLFISAMEEAIAELGGADQPVAGDRMNIYHAFQKLEREIDSSIEHLEHQWMEASMCYARLRSLVYKS